ncbi:MAG: ankyrin repeat domain-containing protein [Acetatifactor sp.]|nr:ankyrin repeat domain-containing protein [Acetatifactor sp.]
MKKRILLFLAISCIISGVALVMFLNSDYYYAKKLVHAVEMGDITTIEQILKKKPSCVSKYPQVLPEKIFNTICEARGTTYPLIVACGMDNFEIVKVLVEAGADVNCNDGRTPLSLTYCAKKEHWYQISLYLIENGVSLDYVTEYSGGTSSVLRDIVQPKPGAALSGYVPESEAEVLAAFNYALEHCDYSNVDWMWVLQESVIFDRVEIVKLLLDENYCDVNDTSCDMTALMFAARSSTIEMTQLLLDRGADKNFVDSTGKTAYDYAVEKGKDDIAFLLAN